MRTANPGNIKSDFLSALQDVSNSLTSISSTPAGRSKDLLLEYLFLGASILLEGFISDLFVAYINRNPDAFAGYLTQRMSVDTEDDYAKRARKYASIDIASHLTMEQIRSILDPRDWNIVFINSSDMKKKAGQWLRPPYKAYFNTLPSDTCAAIEATKAVRNFLAHRSRAAEDSMQKALLNARLPAPLRRGANKVHNVGSFLNSVPVATTQRRSELYLAKIQSVANHLCP